MKSVYFILALIPIAYAGAAAAKSTSTASTAPKTCFQKSKDQLGNTSGISFDDLALLQPKEDSDSYLRLTSIKICTDSSGFLSGLQTGVTKYSAKTNQALDGLIYNTNGKVSGTCKSIKLDPVKKDYVTTINILYDTYMVNQIQVDTALGDYLEVGKSTKNSNEKVKRFWLDFQNFQLIGFFGTLSKQILSLGLVSGKAKCLVGKDPKTIKSPLIPIKTQTNTATPTKKPEAPTTQPTVSPKPNTKQQTQTSTSTSTKPDPSSKQKEEKPNLTPKPTETKPNPSPKPTETKPNPSPKPTETKLDPSPKPTETKPESKTTTTSATAKSSTSNTQKSVVTTNTVTPQSESELAQIQAQANLKIAQTYINGFIEFFVIVPKEVWIIIGVALSLILIIVISLSVAFNGGFGQLKTSLKQGSSNLVRKLKRTSRRRVWPVLPQEQIKTQGNKSNSVIVTDNEISQRSESELSETKKPPKRPYYANESDHQLQDTKRPDRQDSASEVSDDYRR